MNGDEFTLAVTIPANTTATVFVPATNPGAVTESGKPAAQVEGVTFLRQEDNRAVYQVGSGNYRFASNSSGLDNISMRHAAGLHQQ